MFSYDKTDRDDALPFVIYYPNGKAMLLLWTEDEAKVVVSILNTFRESHPIDRPNDINQFIPIEENNHGTNHDQHPMD